jgi:hypothetical protein
MRISGARRYRARVRGMRRVHLAATYSLAVSAVVHAGLTFHLYAQWTPDAVWFLGTALGLLLLAGINRGHIGLSPCNMPTAPIVRGANVLFAVLGVGAVVAIPEPQAYAVLACLVVQAVAAHFTLRVSSGPGREAAGVDIFSAQEPPGAQQN